MVDEAHGSAISPTIEQEQRVRHRLELEFGSREDWDDPKREWRRLFSELLGTFFLVLVAAGGGILVGKGLVGPLISSRRAISDPAKRTLTVRSRFIALGRAGGADIHVGAVLVP
jgi:aquaporin Z